MKKLIVMLLTLSLLVACLSGCSLLGEKNPDEGETTEVQTEPREVIEGLVGEGTKESPYLIGTAEDLALLATVTNDVSAPKTCKNLYFRLTADVDLGGREWLPIGGCFSGHFDGNGHTVSNFKLTNETKAAQVKINSNLTVFANIGLFGLVYEGSVSNLTVSGCTVEMSEKSNNYGCLAGGLYNAALTDCRVAESSVKVSKERGDTNVGGMVGISEGSNIKNCEATAVINAYRDQEASESEGMHVGGLVGMYRSNQKEFPTDYAIIENCKSGSTISVCNNAGSMYVGGVAGYAYEVKGSSFEGTIAASSYTGSIGYDYVGGIAGYLLNAEACSVKGELTANTNGYLFAGGIVSHLTKGKVLNCSFTGSINAATVGYDSYAGGIVGELDTDGWVENCLAAGTISAQSGRLGSACDANAGGIVGKSGQDMTVKSCLSLGSVSAMGSRASAATITGRRTYGATNVDETKHGFYNCHTGMAIGGGAENVAVEGTVATVEQLESVSFYTDVLGWSADVWEIGTPNMENKIYPTLK